MPDVIISKFDESFIRIDASKEILMELSARFSFEVEGARFMPAFKQGFWDGRINLLRMVTQTLFLGLHSYVKEYCDSHQYECVYRDPIDIEAPFSVDEFDRMVKSLCLSTMTEEGREAIIPHDYQAKAVIHAIQSGRCLLLSPTSSGKTNILYMLLRYYLAKITGKILIVVPNTMLVRQIFENFTDYSANVNWEAEELCHLIYDGSEKQTDKRVVITTWQALAVKEHLAKDVRTTMTPEEIKAWNKNADHILTQDYFDQFEVVCGDECHLFASTELSDIMTKLRFAKYRFGTTGTLKECKANHMILEGLFGKVYQTTTTRKLMDEKKVADLFIECLQLQYADEEKQFMHKKTYQEEMEFLLAHVGRNRFIRNLALSLTGNTLLLFERVEKHGKILNEMIQQKVVAGRKVFYVSGKTPTDDRDEVRKITEGETNAILVCSYGTFQTGVSIRNINNVIFGSPAKSKIRVLQSIGRGLRISKRKSKVKLFDISDDLSTSTKAKDLNYSRRHFVERLKYYDDEQFDYKRRKIQLGI